MANGERFDKNDKGLAAHKHLALGTKLKLVNPENGRALTVKITDRGPFVKGRDLDVSLAAAKFLGFTKKGVTKLQAEIVKNTGAG